MRTAPCQGFPLGYLRKQLKKSTTAWEVEAPAKNHPSSALIEHCINLLANQREARPVIHTNAEMAPSACRDAYKAGYKPSKARLTDSWDLGFAGCQLGSHLSSLHNLPQLLNGKCQTACDGLRQLLLQGLVNGKVLQGSGGCDAQTLDSLHSVKRPSSQDVSAAMVFCLPSADVTSNAEIQTIG